MKISVIIPTFKPQDYLWQCLDSLRVQTLPASEWEILLILNGPRDPYELQIKEYIQERMSGIHITLLYSQIQGASAARNMGLDQAQGEYITFIDDDDYVSDCYLEELLVQADKDTIVVSNTIALCDNQLIPYYISKEYTRCASSGKQKFTHPKKYFSSPCIKLIYHDIIGHRRFDTHFQNGEDCLFMFTISDRFQWVDFTSPSALYYRRIRLGSANQNISRRSLVLNSCKLIRQYTNIYLKGHYSFSFYITRILGTIHSIISK